MKHLRTNSIELHEKLAENVAEERPEVRDTYDLVCWNAVSSGIQTRGKGDTYTLKIVDSSIHAWMNIDLGPDILIAAKHVRIETASEDILRRVQSRRD